MSIIRMHNGEWCTAKKVYNNIAGEFKEVKRVLRKGADGVFKEVYFLCVPNTVEGNVVQCYPWPKSDLGLKVYFEPVETPPETGDKGPENPSTITGWDEIEVTRCGKNLFKNGDLDVCQHYGELEQQSDGSWVYIPDDTASSAARIMYSLEKAGFVGTELTASHNISVVGDYVWCGEVGGFCGGYVGESYKKYGMFPSQPPLEKKLTFSPTSADPDLDLLSCFQYVSPTENTTISNIQVELGDTATTYEPYKGDTYTIELPDTFYGGYIDFARGVLVQTWSQYECTGDEGWFADEFFRYRCDDVLTDYAVSVSATQYNANTHFAVFSIDDVTVSAYAYNTGLRVFYKRYPTLPQSDVAAFKTYLAEQADLGTPVTYAYKLATPIEHPLTLPTIKALAGDGQVNTIFANTNGNIVVNYCKYNDITFEATDQSAALVALGVEPAYNLQADTAALAALGVTA